eukprot:GEMP01046267.1.p1 GENE.GEMP01046267.1~~GEMP01046267.1.p1  ORF type:complete len:457 (+),score=90.74 GEMP01046267.1:269-1639(+)
MSSLINAISRVREADIPLLLCVPGLIEGLVSNVLPPLAKVFFFRTLFAGEGPFVKQLFQEWAQAATHGLVQEALDSLVKTRIWRKQIESNEAHYYFLADAQEKFIQRLTSWDANVPVRVNVNPRNLWVYARARWAHFENTCVTPSADPRTIPLINDLVKMLKQRVGENPPWKWLMKSRQEQLWDLFVMYFEAHDYLPPAMMTMASLMPLKLGEALPHERRKCSSIPFLEQIGILMRVQEDFFAITPLCIALFRSDVDIAVTRDDLSEMPSTCFAMEQDALLGFDEMCGGIIVESNFRVFVYTSDIISHQIVSRFCTFEKEIGGALLIATLTVDSVLRALQANITARDIIAFLETHRHKQAAAIPTNVKLQLNLWEQDRFRLQSEEATLFQWSAADYARPDGQRLFQACHAAAGDGILWARLWNQAEPDQRLYPAFAVKAEQAANVERELRTHGLTN